MKSTVPTPLIVLTITGCCHSFCRDTKYHTNDTKRHTLTVRISPRGAPIFDNKKSERDPGKTRVYSGSNQGA